MVWNNWKEAIDVMMSSRASWKRGEAKMKKKPFQKKQQETKGLDPGDRGVTQKENTE